MPTEYAGSSQQYPSQLNDDEISLVDIWRTLVRRKKIIYNVILTSLILGLLAAFLLPKKYMYSTSIEIGTTVINTGTGTTTRLVDDPQTVQAKITESYIPLAMHNYAEQNSDDNKEYKITVRIPKKSEIIVLEGKGTEKEEKIYKGLLEKIVENIINDHKRLMSVNRSRIEVAISKQKIKLNELQDPTTLAFMQKELEKQLIMAQTKQDELEDPKVLDVPKNKLKAKLSQANKVKLDLKDEARFIKGKLKRLDEVDRLLNKQIKELEAQITTALNQRNKIFDKIGTESSAMTMLMLDNELQQNRTRLADLEERLHVTQKNLRDEYSNNLLSNQRQQAVQVTLTSELQSEYDKLLLDNKRNQNRNKPDVLKLEVAIKKLIADNQREIVNQKQIIYDLETQLENIKETNFLIKPIKSLKPVGVSKLITLILSLVLGAFIGFVAAFVSEFVTNVKVNNE